MKTRDDFSRRALKARRLGRLPSLKKRERPFEYRLRDELKTRDIMFTKFKPSVKGLPDRLAMGNENMLLAEIKREGEDLEDHQKVMHARIYRLTGRRVMVIHGPDVKKAANFVELCLETWGQSWTK